MKTKIGNLWKNVARLLIVLFLGIALLGCATACGDNTVKLVSITTSGNYQTEYKEGDVFRPKGLVVVANYSDGTQSDPLTTRDYTYTKMPLVAGENTIEISYTEGEITAKATLKVTAVSVTTDTGELVDYRFEGEEAEIYGNGGANSKNLYDHASVPNAYKFGTEFGGNVCLYNTFGMRMEYVFNCDKAVKVKLTVRHGVYRSSGYIYGNSIFKHFVITNNGENAEELDPIGNDSDPTYVKSGISKYFDMISTDVVVELVEGENILVIAPTTATVNLDYVELHTSAKITGFTPSYIQDPEYSVVMRAIPTAEKEGKIAFIDTAEEKSYGAVIYTLPKLSESDYDVIDGDYYLKLVGKTIRLTAVNAQSHTFTIKGDAVFAENLSNSIEVKEQLFLPEIICKDKYSTVLKWKDSDGKEYNAMGYTMPDHDVEMEAVIGVADNVISGNGRLNLGYHSTRTYYIDQGVNQHMGYNVERDLTVMTDLTVNGSYSKQKTSTRQHRTEDGEEYLFFAIQGIKDRLFRFTTEYNTYVNVEYEFTYTVKNFSDSEDSIVFDIVIQYPGDPYGYHLQHERIELAPGESVDLTYIMHAVESVDQLHTYLIILEDCAGANVGLYCHVNEYNDVWESVYGTPAA